MRRSCLFAVLMMTLCLLCACGGKEQEPLEVPMAHRAALLAHGGCRFTLEAAADTGDRVWSLTLDCALDPSGDGTVTVLAPESIAGITAVSEGGKGSLRYDDLALGLGTLPGTELAPAAAPARLVRAWASDWIASAGFEGRELLACYEAEPLCVYTRFDENGVPVLAELALEGQVRFRAEIRNFEWKAGTTDETTEENLG